MMSLRNLMQYQLSEGLTEQELAKDIGVSKFTIHRILRGRDPKSPDIWKKLARYFHMDMDLLRFGKLDLATFHKEKRKFCWPSSAVSKGAHTLLDSSPLCRGTARTY